MRFIFLLATVYVMASHPVYAGVDPIFSRIIQEHLESYPTDLSSQQKAQRLSHEIDVIAKEALRKRVDFSTYQPRKEGNNLFFTARAIWEGQAQGIPLTFFVYAWPAECDALALNPSQKWYSSDVHRHPIPCALAVIKGILTQENYIDVPGYTCNVARLDSVENLHEGKKIIDDLSKTTIHRLFYRGRPNTYCLSLHAYGLPSEREVLKSFTDTYKECVYSYILQEDGTFRRDQR